MHGATIKIMYWYCLPTMRNDLSIPSSRIMLSEQDYLTTEDGTGRLSRNVGDYQPTPCNNPEERRPHTAVEAWNLAQLYSYLHVSKTARRNFNAVIWLPRNYSYDFNTSIQPMKVHGLHAYSYISTGRLRLKSDGTRTEIRFRSFGETDESI